jgi:tetraacyldisaccharide 4'-kinase
VDAIVLDDGFQHWRLKRDVDIVLVDGRMGFGNDALLPAGPLREPLSALRRADAIVVTKVDAPGEIGHALQRCAPGVPIFSAELTPDCIVHAEEGALRTRPLGDLVGRAVVIVSAVAQPESFYRLLAQLEARPVEVLEYPDHHPFTQTDWQRINHAARRAELVVCTEKDLVKLRRFPFARGGLAALRVRFAPAPGEEAELYALIQRRLDQAVGAYARNA